MGCGVDRRARVVPCAAMLRTARPLLLLLASLSSCSTDESPATGDAGAQQPQPDAADPGGPGEEADARMGECVPATCESLNACGDAVPDGCSASLECGGCSEGACGGGGDAHRCGCGVSETVVSDQLGAASLVRDGDTFYWTSGDAVWRRVGGGLPEVFEAGQASIANLAIDASHVYWATDTAVVRRSKAGGATETLVSDIVAAYQVAVDDTHVYYTWSAGNPLAGVISRVKKTGGAPQMLSSGLGWTYALAVDGAHYYVASFSLDAILRGAKGGGSATTWVSTAGPGELALDAAHVYWAGDERKVQRRTKNGAITDTLATNQADIIALAVDDRYVAWGSQTAASPPGVPGIYRKPLAGGAIETLETDVGKPSTVLMDATYVYWTDRWDGVLRRQAPLRQRIAGRARLTIAPRGGRSARARSRTGRRRPAARPSPVAPPRASATGEQAGVRLNSLHSHRRRSG